MKENKQLTTYYKNGFVVKLLNRRVECLKRTDGDYNVIFIRFSREPFTEKELERFDRTINRMGGTLTYAYVRLSEEALFFLSQGFLMYDNFNKQTANDNQPVD